MRNILEELKSLVIFKGFEVAVDSDFCKKFKETHKNCSGCEMEEGCSRYVHLLAIMAKSRLYTPTSFEDSLNRDKWVRQQMRNCLDKNYSLEKLRDEI